jgi:ribose 5-phosphate isomerase RpiB
MKTESSLLTHPLTARGTLSNRILFVGYDHNGRTVGSSLTKFLRGRSRKVKRIGRSNETYVTIAAKVAARIDETTAGILICGSGMGM